MVGLRCSGPSLPASGDRRAHPLPRAAPDFQLGDGSPAQGAGLFGEDLGAHPRRDATRIGPDSGLVTEVVRSCFD